MGRTSAYVVDGDTAVPAAWRGVRGGRRRSAALRVKHGAPGERESRAVARSVQTEV